MRKKFFQTILLIAVLFSYSNPGIAQSSLDEGAGEPKVNTVDMSSLALDERNPNSLNEQMNQTLRA